MLNLSDSHTHLDDYPSEELEEVIRRAREAGVGRIITAGTTVDSSRAAISIAEVYPDVYVGVGIHPMEVDGAIGDKTMEELKQMASSSERVVVVSEPGLDYLKGKAPRERQQQVFRQHIRLARELKLPVIFHSRDAYWDCLRILKEEHAYE
ncbi:MAG: TatD family hydrolase, partial [Dehalococcoidia bacterium]